MDTFIGRRHQSLGEVADAVQLPKSTTHRLLMTLESRGYITSVYGESGMYKIGLKGLWFTTARTRIHHQLEKLASLTGETVNLGAVTGTEIEYVDRVLSEHALRWGVDIGSRIPLHCSALGKCVLAYRDDLFPRLVELPRRTAKTITDSVELKAHLEVIRHRGYAFEDEEFIEGVLCIAAPVRDDHGEVMGAVSVSGPGVRFTKEIAIGFAEQVMTVAESVSYSIGYHIQSNEEDA
ncbi:IclR family transcriptional regulator [Alicyclobacillus mengziensis]|uniref:IclR family transcriptional regulator n=1 Tax=Alicyclobacillus mengziensis TaxID=2931921 RepID=A0A9X7W413_9BACL|nr:IclR family transcriptional regulator [Alicyclobacillus mengziensis]QSO50035.1 IclR family transcriptional regulator [Alicyclobacillus mengziensis]